MPKLSENEEVPKPDSMIVYFPKNPPRVTQDGYILSIRGKDIEQEFAEIGQSRTTDDYNIDVDTLPIGPGIFVWEGELDMPSHEFETRPFNGKWRPAQAHDLQLAGLILGMVS